ncbi:MAG: amylo-alpha-1,6-glucosidase [Vulcanimicrobiota bacterium]
MNLTVANHRGNSQLLNNFKTGIQNEWLLTDGMGGFASSTILGCNTRRYHGLLTCSCNNQRNVLVSKVEERLKIRNKTYHLSTNLYKNSQIYPHGYNHLREFSLVPHPRFIYTIGPVVITKEIIMVKKKNTTIVRFQVNNPTEQKIKFTITPLLAFRDFHKLQAENSQFDTETHFNNSILSIKPCKDLPELKIKAGEFEFTRDAQWYKQFEYLKEKERGLDYNEDLFSPGFFIKEFDKDIKLEMYFSIEQEITGNFEKETHNQTCRIRNLFKQAAFSKPDIIQKTLIWASDQHVIERVEGNGNKCITVIAGYPWFGDWGRDTFISLPGLCLVTGRFSDAKKILINFSRQCKNGIIPNRFGDVGREPIYNTVDASLWFINAVHHYLSFTNDNETIKKLLPTIEEIIQNYKAGTDFGIHMEEDGLIAINRTDVQLTWMDAKVGDWVVTPRNGKPVEINAIWYNALNIYKELCRQFNYKCNISDSLIKKVKKSFNGKFWNETAQCLYDVVKDSNSDGKIRPNQIYAISLPYSVLNKRKWKPVISNVSDHLYTPFGLRSLSNRDPDYRKEHTGPIRIRDGAYHMGTVWGYLMGPFLEALLKTANYSDASFKQVEQLFKLWMNNLASGGLNTLSEIFDGDEPFKSRGCYSQAWSVAEALRISYLLEKINQ